MTRSRSRLTKSAKLRLVALLNGQVAGNVYQIGNGRLVFVYDDAWREQRDSYPLSLSMPLTASQHGHKATHAYLWGLLPDNSETVASWAKKFGVSRYRVVDLLASVGEDCPGAVQFALPDRAMALAGTATIEDENIAVDWLTEDDVASRLRELRANPGAGRAPSDTGQFSLPGAQPKTALYQSANGRWGVPRGRMPTNRIIKPPTLDLADLAYNEHYCLSLARAVGLVAATSSVQLFGDEEAIVLERYDRTIHGKQLLRIHQEDSCQALGIMPDSKYEDRGGPGIADIVEVLRSSSSEPLQDVQQFLDAMILNWFLAGTDAHGKNFSILLARGPQLRLAPIYDLISTLPYPKFEYGIIRLAMSVGGEWRIAALGQKHWESLARDVGIAADELLGRIRLLAERTLDCVGAFRTSDVAAIRHLASRTEWHVTECLGRMTKRVATYNT